MALVSICLMFSLSSCDWLTVRVDDSKTCLHSARGQISDVKKYDIKFAANVHVPLEIKCDNFGDPLTFHLEQHQFLICLLLILVHMATIVPLYTVDTDSAH